MSFDFKLDWNTGLEFFAWVMAFLGVFQMLPIYLIDFNTSSGTFFLAAIAAKMLQSKE